MKKAMKFYLVLSFILIFLGLCFAYVGAGYIEINSYGIGIFSGLFGIALLFAGVYMLNDLNKYIRNRK